MYCVHIAQMHMVRIWFLPNLIPVSGPDYLRNCPAPDPENSFFCSMHYFEEILKIFFTECFIVFVFERKKSEQEYGVDPQYIAP